MQATQPLAKAPQPASGIASAIKQGSGTTTGALKATSAATIAPNVSTSPAKADTASIVLSILAFLGATAAGVFSFLVFKAAELPDWVK